MISGNRDEAWPMYLAWPIPERFMLGVIRWHVTCMLSLAGHWQDRRALSNHVCAHSVIPMWHVVCLQHLARASSEQSRSTTVLPVNHVIQIPQCLSGFVNHDYWRHGLQILDVWLCSEASDHDDAIKWKIFRVTGHLCGNSPVTGEFPAQRPVTRSFDVFFDLRLNKRLSKQRWGWWS